jgi:hypothetical protein
MPSLGASERAAVMSNYEYLLQHEVEAQYEPGAWTFAMFRRRCGNAALLYLTRASNFTCANLIEMTRLSLELGGRVGRSGR